VVTLLEIPFKAAKPIGHMCDTQHRFVAGMAEGVERRSFHFYRQNSFATPLGDYFRGFAEGSVGRPCGTAMYSTVCANQDFVRQREQGAVGIHELAGRQIVIARPFVAQGAIDSGRPKRR
jgi:hypothetical protein